MSSTTARDARSALGPPVRLDCGAIATPIGRLAVAWHEDAVVGVFMAHAERPGRWDTGYREGDPLSHLRAHLAKRYGDITRVRETEGRPLDALRRYFEGDLTAVDALAVDPGGTSLQGRIWTTLRTIPPGETMTYGELARAVGRPGASRAAGRAVGTNPIPVIVPCHRIVGAGGALTGFGGGLSRKQWLLRHEGATRELV